MGIPLVKTNYFCELVSAVAVLKEYAKLWFTSVQVLKDIWRHFTTDANYFWRYIYVYILHYNIYYINIIDNIYMWCVARFWNSHYLAFAWSFERTRMHANALLYLHIVFIHLHELAWHSNGSIKCQTLECHSIG